MLSNSFSGIKVLVTGGLGMIGSTIANTLARNGAKVTVFDACLEPYGANTHNIAEHREKIELIIGDIRDPNLLKEHVQGKDIVFSLAGQVCHNESIHNPVFDAEINYMGHLNVLEAIRNYNKEAVVVYSGSRLQYGKIEYNPVNEEHPLKPETPYAFNKYAAERMYNFYNRMYGIKNINFRIANPYGPRCQMKHGKYGIINWFIRTALEGGSIKIFGDGLQLRDYIYVDDLAEAFINASMTKGCIGQSYNIGSGVGCEFSKMVKTVVEIVGSGTVEYVPWPPNYINVETGDYVADIVKIRTAIGWEPKTPLAHGIYSTLRYYQENKMHYW